MKGLCIRRCVTGDAAALAAMYAADREEFDEREDDLFFTAEGQLERITSTWTEHECIGFLVTVELRVAALVVLEDIKDGSTTVGYHVASPERGRGVATAALAAVIEIARDELRLREVRAGIDRDNTASRAVLVRNGFVATGPVLEDGHRYDEFVLRLG